MTTIRRPAGRDALHATWLLALEVLALTQLPQLLTMLEFSYVYVADPSVFGVPGQFAGGFLLAGGLGLLGAVPVLLATGVLVARRRGLRLAPAALLAGLPLGVLLAFSPLAPR
ncbi:MAG: hypothetical protein LBV78_11865 [Kitasatospora sp.]|jgi:hypothetical protein|nr:hypothetical protein [Kitasatospora sp.]